MTRYKKRTSFRPVGLNEVSLYSGFTDIDTLDLLILIPWIY